MTPEERQILIPLLDRLRQTPVPEKDAEADQLIRELLQAKPEVSYLLVQSVLVQDYAMRHVQAQLQAAQGQIADLQRQLAEARNAPPAKTGGFLSGLFGSSAPALPASGPNPGDVGTSVPSVNPWGRPLNPGAPYPGAGAQYSQPQQSYQPPPSYAQNAGYGQQGAPPVFQPQQSSGFLRGAAQTAMGVAGGALLFEGVQSLFGGHGGFGGGMGGFGGPGFGGTGFGGLPQENVTEVINNNYYGDSNPGSDLNPSDYNGPGNDPGFSNADFDPGQDAGGFDNSDFGSGNDDWV